MVEAVLLMFVEFFAWIVTIFVKSLNLLHERFVKHFVLGWIVIIAVSIFICWGLYSLFIN